MAIAPSPAPSPGPAHASGSALPSGSAPPPPSAPAGAQRTVTCVELPSSLQAAADARSTVRRALGRVPVEEAAVACLLVDELVADALFHVGAPLTLVIDHQPGRVVAEVVEHGPAAAGLGARHAGARRILDGMAADWGVEPQGAGASTWFALDLT